MKYTLLIKMMFLAIFVPLTAYSQSTDNIRWSLIREQLLERQACVRAYEKEKERCDSLRYQLTLSDYLLESMQKDEDDLTVAVQACERLQEKAFSELSACEIDKKKAEKERDKEKNGKKVWRTLAGVFLVGDIILASLHLNSIK